MKILVVFTGGTIGSRVKDGYIMPTDGGGFPLLENYILKHGRQAEFETCVPYTALSETLNADRLNRLADSVNNAQASGYDGVIVTHGTDTLQYSAAALSLTVDAKVPTVLVSSNYPLTDKRANGYDNFSAAVELIKAKKKGVFVSYKNADGRQLYHRADRLMYHPEMSDELKSLDGPYGELENGTVKIYGEDISTADFAGAHFVKKPGILAVGICPEDGYSYCLDGIKAILLKPYHSGTLDVENPNFRRLCFDAATRQIPVFVSGILPGEQYETSSYFEELGIIPLCSVPFTQGYVKLWLAISGNKNLKELI